jgi:hypothetical protein
VNALDYMLLHRLVFSGDWPGYKPDVVEYPNGDGKADVAKRYAHIRHEHLRQGNGDPGREFAADIFETCFRRACEVAVSLGIPSQYWPAREECCLRVLDYPPGAGSAEHTDFDLFTLNVYRNLPELLVSAPESSFGEGFEDVHAGELLKECGMGYDAAPHYVEASPHEAQFSVVFFAMPSKAAKLTSGITSEDWVAERKARSRAPRDGRPAS